MQFDVNIRLYEYWHEQVKIRKKRRNNKEIKKFYWKWIFKQKVRKKEVVRSTSACGLMKVKVYMNETDKTDWLLK